MALKRVTDAQPMLQLYAAVRRRAWTLVMQLLAQALVKQHLAQILVVVANIQMRALKTEVVMAPCEHCLDMG